MPARRIAVFAAVTLLSLSAAAFSPAALGQAAPRKEYGVPAGSLEDALNAFARQAAITLSFDPALVRGRSAPALRGSYTVDEGLAALLKGSGLEPVQAGGAITLRRAVSQGEQQLSEVKVTGAADGLQPKSASTLGPLGELPLLDVPYSVSVIPQELIRNENPTRLTEALRYVPGVLNNQPGGSYYDQVMVRGFDLSLTTNYRKNNLPMIIRGDTGFENIERLELYKGPSAMFYGFAAPGGVVNYVTKRPPGSGLVAGLQASANEFGGWALAADLGARAGEDGQFGYRVNLGHEDIANHIHDFGGKREFASIALDWRLTADTLLQFDYDQQDKRTQIQPGVQIGTASQLPDSLDPRKFLGQSWTYHEANTSNTILQITHRFTPDWSVRLAGNYQEIDRPYKFSNVGLVDKTTGQATASFGILQNYYYTSAGVLQFDGKVRTGGISHELILGYSPQEIQYDEYRAFPAFGLPFNVFNPTAYPEPFQALGPLRRFSYENKSTYAMDRITLSERWQAILGVRHNEYKQISQTSPTFRTEYAKSADTPTVGLTFKPSADLAIYASYMEGLEQGGVAPTGTTNAGEVMKPLISKQYEAGVKADLATGLTLSAALFEISKPSEYSKGGTYVQDGRQVHRGFELGVAGRATRNLSLYGGLMLLDATLEETATPALNGKAPGGVPEQSLSLYADYRIPVAEGWSVSAGVVNVGKRVFVAGDDTRGEVPGYSLLNLGARYEFKAASGRARILFNLDNATNEFYWDTVSTDLQGALTMGASRTFRVTAQFDL